LISFAFRLFWEKEAQEKGIYQIEQEKTEAPHLSYVEELHWKGRGKNCKSSLLLHAKDDDGKLRQIQTYLPLDQFRLC